MNKSGNVSNKVSPSIDATNGNWWKCNDPIKSGGEKRRSDESLVTTSQSQLNARSVDISQNTSDELISFPVKVFALKDIMNLILACTPFSQSEKLKMKCVSKLFKSVIGSILDTCFYIRCATPDFLDLYSKLPLNTNDAKASELQDPLAISLETHPKSVQELENLINFIKDPINEPVVSRLEQICLGSIRKSNKNKMGELLDLLNEKKDKLSKLKTIVFDIIYENFQLKDLPSTVTTIVINGIFGEIDILKSLPSCVTKVILGARALEEKILKLSTSVKSLILKTISENDGFGLDLTETEVESLVVDRICQRGILQLKLPVSLISFSVDRIDGAAQFSIVGEFPEKLESLFFGPITGLVAIFAFPKFPDSLTSFSYEEIKGNPILIEKFQEFKQKIDARNRGEVVDFEELNFIRR